jgi:hypothetical protein
MMKPHSYDLEAYPHRLAQNVRAAQTSTVTEETTQGGTIRYKGIGGQRAACQRLLFNIAASGVSLMDFDKFSTSILFPEGVISYKVSGTPSQIATFRRLVDGSAA